MNKREGRIRRSKRTRMKIRELEAVRLCVHRTLGHIYAQVISPNGSEVLACASTLDQQVKSKVKSTGNKEAAALVGKLVAERAKKAGVEKVAFDRSGYSYHGRVKALAEAVRESGLLA